MNGVHDLGGTDGLGPVIHDDPTDPEPVWGAEWEKTAFAFFATAFRAGLFGVDAFRYGIEQMHPVSYLASPYYEHWAHTVEHYGVKAGVFDPAEIEAKTTYFLDNPDAPLPERQDPDLLAFIDAAVTHGAHAKRDSDAPPAFAVGDRVTVADDSPAGHTRKARYVRGRTGEIVMAHGTFIYPDSAGNGGEEGAEHVYTVRFDAEELWGSETADPNGVVHFDVWEPYITLATEGASA